MPRDGSGNFSLTYDWTTDESNSIPITASRFDTQEGDIAAEITNSVAKDGQSTMSGNLKMGSNKITGLGTGTAATDAATVAQAQGSILYFGLTGGTSTAFTLSPSPSISAYTTGSPFIFQPHTDSGASPTVNISSVGDKDLKKFNGDGTKTAIEAGDLQDDQFYLAVYDGTDVVVGNPEKIVDLAFGTATIDKLVIPDKGELTISSGAVTVTGSNHTLDTESDASSDDLDTINGLSDGQIISVKIVADARNVVLKHNTGNIFNPLLTDITLDATTDVVFLQYNSSLSKCLVLSCNLPATVDYTAGVSKTYNTIYQASQSGFLVIKLAGTYMNGAQLEVGATSPPTTILGEWGDDINSGTKEVSACYPISKGDYYRLAPLSGRDAWETITFTFYPLKFF